MRPRSLSIFVWLLSCYLRQGLGQDQFTQMPQELNLPIEILTEQNLFQDLKCAL